MNAKISISKNDDLNFSWFFQLLRSFYKAPFGNVAAATTSNGLSMAKNRLFVMKHWGKYDGGRESERLIFEPSETEQLPGSAFISYKSGLFAGGTPRTISANIRWTKNSPIIANFYPRIEKDKILSSDITTKFLLEGVLNVPVKKADYYISQNDPEIKLPVWDTPAEVSAQIIYRVFFRTPEKNSKGESKLPGPADEFKKVIRDDLSLQFMFCKLIQKDLIKFIEHHINKIYSNQMDLVFFENLVKSFLATRTLIQDFILLMHDINRVVIVDDDKLSFHHSDEFENTQRIFQTMLTDVFRCIVHQHDAPHGSLDHSINNAILDNVAIIGRLDNRCLPLLHIFTSMVVLEKADISVSRSDFDILMRRFNAEKSLSSKMVDQVFSGPVDALSETLDLPIILFRLLFKFYPDTNVVALCHHEKSLYELVFEKQEISDKTLFKPADFRDHEEEIEAYCKSMIRVDQKVARLLPVQDMLTFSHEYCPLTFTRSFPEKDWQHTKIDFNPVMKADHILYTARRYAGLYFRFFPQIDLTDFDSLIFKIRSQGISRITIEFKYANKWPQFDYVIEPTKEWQEIRVPLKIIPDNHRNCIEEIVFMFDALSFSELENMQGDFDIASITLI